MWHRKKTKTKGTRRSAREDAHFKAHKEFARSIVHERIAHWNQYYNFSFNRVSIKAQRRCWGSCSEKGNLNFNYKIILLPETLMDYVIVHELCHLAELNHSRAFWNTVAVAMPEFESYRRHLGRITHVPMAGFPSSRLSRVAENVN